uniref:Uncharacterized protein n=1 Tax=Arundo donax TaxID=35708 RepID=A0A0A9FSN0_ARUDO
MSNKIIKWQQSTISSPVQFQRCNKWIDWMQ